MNSTRLPTLAAVLLVLAMVAPNMVRASPATFSQRYELFRQSSDEFPPGMTSRDQALRVVQAYKALGPDEITQHLQTASAEDLRVAFKAADTLSFWTREPVDALRMRDIVLELHRRGIAKEEHFSTVHRQQVAARLFELARQWKARFPTADMQDVPTVLNDDSYPDTVRTVLRSSDSPRVLRREVLALSQKPFVLVIGSPMCHFARNASIAIEKDQILKKRFEQHARWLAPQAQFLEFDALLEWNRLHPASSYAVVYRQSEWPEISDWSTPAFYFFKNGKVVSTVTGWPAEGNADMLAAGFRQIGL